MFAESFHYSPADFRSVRYGELIDLSDHLEQRALAQAKASKSPTGRALDGAPELEVDE